MVETKLYTIIELNKINFVNKMYLKAWISAG